MEKQMSCDDVAGGVAKQEAEIDKFFELLKKLRDARKRLRDQSTQVIKTTKSFDDLHGNNSINNNTIDDDDDESYDNCKKRKVKSEGPSNLISDCWIGSFEEDDFFTSNRQTSPQGQNTTTKPMISEQPSERHHDGGRLNLNLTL